MVRVRSRVRIRVGGRVRIRVRGRSTPVDLAALIPVSVVRTIERGR